jgi:CRISPR/Cas system CSM-associated protein Csm2 small subunit
MTQEEIEHRLKQMEIDLIRLDAVTEDTANKLNRLAGIVSDLAENQKKTDEIVANLGKAVFKLAETVDRFVRGQRNGDQPH